MWQVCACSTIHRRDGSGSNNNYIIITGVCFKMACYICCNSKAENGWIYRYIHTHAWEKSFAIETVLWHCCLFSNTKSDRGSNTIHLPDSALWSTHMHVIWNWSSSWSQAPTGCTQVARTDRAWNAKKGWQVASTDPAWNASQDWILNLEFPFRFLLSLILAEGS